MNLNGLVKTTHKRKRRLGQGHGSGRVKTAGRGTKGQNARSRVSSSFEGGAVSLIKRLPFLKGKNKNKSFRSKPICINVKALGVMKKNDTVDIESLIAYRLVEEGKAKRYGVKILGEGQLSLSLVVKLPVSLSARKKIEAAGGHVDYIKQA